MSWSSPELKGKTSKQGAVSGAFHPSSPVEPGRRVLNTRSRDFLCDLSGVSSCGWIQRSTKDLHFHENWKCSQMVYFILVVLGAWRPLADLLVPLVRQRLHLDSTAQKVLRSRKINNDTGAGPGGGGEFSFTSWVSRRVKKGLRYLASSHIKPFRSCRWKIWASYSSSVSSDRCSDSMVLPWRKRQAVG